MSDHLIEFDRAGRITASVVGAILRHDESHSQRWAWRVITGREPERVNRDMQRGLDHEDDAIESLEIELGVLAFPGRFVAHPDLDWLGGSPDGFISESGILVPVEAKCPRMVHAEIPLHYYDQVQTQVECCDVPYGYFISWEGDRQRVWRVERDDEWWTLNRPLLESFYRDYVEADLEPPKAPRRSKCLVDIQRNAERNSMRARIMG